MKQRFKNFFLFLQQVAKEFASDNVLKYSASLSYYTIFSLIPMLFMIIAVCGAIFGKEAMKGQVYEQMNGLVGSDAAMQIQDALKNIHLNNDNIGMTIFSFVILMIGSTGIFSEMQDSLNKIWGLKIKTKKSWWKLILDRLVSFSLILSVGFVLMVSLALNAIVTMLGKKLTLLLFNSTSNAFPILENILSFASIVFLFAIIFKTLPDAKIKWKDVIVGAIITGVLFTVGKFAIGYYLGTSKVASIYGAAASVVVILVWTYYSSMILYLGAEFTKVYAKLYGGKIYPNEYSVWIKVEEIPVNNITLNKEIK